MCTTYAVLDALTTAYDQTNVNEYTGLISLNYTKSFDTVCHSTLLSKLIHYGIRDEANKLLNSFLSNCKQYAAYQNFLSDISWRPTGL